LMQSQSLRAFIAIEIPAGIQQAISRETSTLRQALPARLVRWVAPQNIHLTMQFLGDISPQDLEQLAAGLKDEVARQTAFEVLANGIGAFPNPRRARVLWVGLEAPAALPMLYQVVTKVTTRLGHVPEERGFSPHVTIARVDRQAAAADLTRIHAALERSRLGSIGQFQVDSVKIFKSDLRPTGPIYTCLHSLPLAKAQNAQFSNQNEVNSGYS
jgi:RNA 2',3'-cyclic 3'-phosphodiesterase